MMDSPYDVPNDPLSAPFWAALQRGRIALQYSPAAGRWQFPPLECCRFTGAALEWREIDGRGQVYSYIVQVRPVTPDFVGLCPYVIALIEPDGASGVRLPARLIGIEPEAVRIGLSVRLATAPDPAGDRRALVARPL